MPSARAARLHFLRRLGGMAGEERGPEGGAGQQGSEPAACPPSVCLSVCLSVCRPTILLPRSLALCSLANSLARNSHTYEDQRSY